MKRETPLAWQDIQELLLEAFTALLIAATYMRRAAFHIRYSENPAPSRKRAHSPLSDTGNERYERNCDGEPRKRRQLEIRRRLGRALRSMQHGSQPSWM